MPTSVLLRDRFENIDKIGAIGAPVLILHGDADTVIPASHAKALATASSSVEPVVFAGIGHDLAWRDEAEQRMQAFLAELGSD